MALQRITPPSSLEQEALLHYEGLVCKTALLLAAMRDNFGRPWIESELDDIRQVLWIKVIKATRAYDPAKARGLTRDGYVNMCLTDQVKDLRKRRRRNELHIEALVGDDDDSPGLPSRDSFEKRYLAAEHGDVYGHLDNLEELRLPNTLSPQERDVLGRLLAGHRSTEIYRTLGIGRNVLEDIMASLRVKLADWKPTTVEHPRCAA